MVLILLSSDNVSSSVIVIILSNCQWDVQQTVLSQCWTAWSAIFQVLCFNDISIWSDDLKFYYQMVSDKCPRNGNFTLVNHLSEMRVLKVHLKIVFSNSDPSWNQTELWTSSFWRDTHFQDFEDLSSFRWKIKFTKGHFHSEKAYTEYTCNVSFFVQYISIFYNWWNFDLNSCL